MNYIDTVTTPNKILIQFAIKPPGIQTVVHEGSYFYIDNFPSMNLIYPPEEASARLDEPIVFIAGEKDTIKWDAGGAISINLEYSDDDGSTYQSIVSNYPADSGKYKWEVPSSLLTRKAKIKLTENQNTSNKVESTVFTIKPWQLTRIDASDELELFEPNQDGWVFSNARSNVWPQTWWQQFNYSGTDPITGESYPLWFPFINADASDFPDWPLFVEVFGVENCYVFGNSYRSEATTHWGGIWSGIRSNWGGSCFGFSVSSLLGFYHKSSLVQKFPGIGNFSDLFNVPLGRDSRLAVNHYMVHQFSEEVRSLRGTRGSYSPRDLLQDTKDMFRKENGDGRILYYRNNSGSGAHEVTPYKLQRIGTSPRFNLTVYDNRAPGSTNAQILIDSAANQWSDFTGLGWGTGSIGCFLEEESVKYLNQPTIPGSKIENQKKVSFPSLASNLIFYNSSYADITISASNGDQIGFQDSTVFNSIDGAFPVIPATTSYQPPIGYDLPLDSYMVQMTNFEDSSSYAFFMSEGTIYNYRRPNAVTNEMDILEYSDSGIGIINPDGTAKTASLETIILEDSTSEKIFAVNNFSISAGDSVKVKEENRENLVVQNYGSSMNYDLQVRYVSENGLAIFSNESISLSANTGHTVVPAWNDLTNTPIKIYIDNGNDGTIDDSTTISNQLTGVKGSSVNLNPEEFHLAQNYPNPFNPSTIIKYSIPVAGHLNLKVYDILGNEIAELVNEEKGSGVYSVSFDASGLASGMYLYRLQAGSFVETKKMILMK